MKFIFTLEIQVALTGAASPTSATISDVEEPAECLFSIPVMPDDKEDWTIGDFVEADSEEPVKVKRCLRGLQEFCRTRDKKDWVVFPRLSL